MRRVILIHASAQNMAPPSRITSSAMLSYQNPWNASFILKDGVLGLCINISLNILFLNAIWDWFAQTWYLHVLRCSKSHFLVKRYPSPNGLWKGLHVVWDHVRLNLIYLPENWGISIGFWFLRSQFKRSNWHLEFSGLSRCPGVQPRWQSFSQLSSSARRPHWSNGPVFCWHLDSATRRSSQDDAFPLDVVLELWNCWKPTISNDFMALVARHWPGCWCMFLSCNPLRSSLCCLLGNHREFGWGFPWEVRARDFVSISISGFAASQLW